METKIIVLMLLFAVVFPLVLNRLLHKMVTQKLCALGMNRFNYDGDPVLTGGGLILVYSSAITGIVLVGLLLLRGAKSELLLHGILFVIGMLIMAFWGWRDDRASDRDAKGFRGHFGVLWRERRMTSGMWKLIGGTSTAFCLSLTLSNSLWSGIVSFGLLALSPNIINLFDLRPGRALKVFWCLTALTGAFGLWIMWASAATANWIFLIPVFIASILMFPHDAGGKIMLGDTGSNALGFAAGFTFVIGTPVYVQVCMLVLFLCLQIAAEFCSFSRVIEQVGWLHRLDQWGRATGAENKKNQTGSSGLV
ncbi:UDP-N-acetylmuramyl pentapeptide phosphotransferase [Brevibacillus fortis]|uniref:UDP-N-acetylmuramyl pentapeptide phosphotransferase n=1 Tax=Brevibacillus fortis TaxID=2126352 RepID=UPI002E1F63F4|nr:UDP-N-acetylmuramyl pentapeptide phosphotransferase [Brevibacillus fortis]